MGWWSFQVYISGPPTTTKMASGPTKPFYYCTNSSVYWSISSLPPSPTSYTLNPRICGFAIWRVSLFPLLTLVIIHYEELWTYSLRLALLAWSLTAGAVWLRLESMSRMREFLLLWAFSYFEIFNIQSSHFDPFYQYHLHWKSVITELPRTSGSRVLESWGWWWGGGWHKKSFISTEHYS